LFGTCAFTPVLAKHTKHLSLVDVLSIGIERIERNFEPMSKQVEACKSTGLHDKAVKLVIYLAFVEGKVDAPKHVVRLVPASISILSRVIHSANGTEPVQRLYECV
jgi:hypothetical protein